MHITLWILQALLALHTLIGAIWKFSHEPSETMPSLSAISHSTWIAIALVEIVIAIVLIMPAIKKHWGQLVPLASAAIAAEMLFFCGLHFGSGDKNYQPIGYWAVVFAVCVFVTWGRLSRRPHVG